MNPKEYIDNDKRLTALLEGLRSTWGYGDEFLSIVLWHTDDYDLASEVIELFMLKEKMDLEEALFQCMNLDDFKEKCLESDFLNYSKCKELVNEKSK